MNRFTRTTHRSKPTLWVRYLVIALMLWCCVGRAQERTAHTYRPARFGTSSDSLLGKLECPEKRGPQQRVVVFCQAHIRVDGMIAGKASYCFGEELRDRKITYRGTRYVKSTERALRTARFLPAEVDGVPVPVYFSFQVVFEDDQGCVTTAFPHMGSQMSELGPGYVAPQEILTNGGWFKRGRVSFSPFAVGRIGVRYAMSVLVDANGRASDGRIEFSSDGVPDDETVTAVTALKGAKFIPGFYRGKPRAMRYFEILFIPP